MDTIYKHTFFYGILPNNNGIFSVKNFTRNRFKNPPYYTWPYKMVFNYSFLPVYKRWNQSLTKEY